MATPVEPKPETENNNLHSRTGGQGAIDPVRVSAEAPAPDLVERLRGPIAEAVQKLVNGCFRNANGPVFHIPAQETDPDLLASKGVQEAADTITGLRAENERLKAQCETPFMDGYETAKEEYRPRLIALDAENERLREALGEIHAISGTNNRVAQLARAALTQEPRI